MPNSRRQLPAAMAFCSSSESPAFCIASVSMPLIGPSLTIGQSLPAIRFFNADGSLMLLGKVLIASNSTLRLPPSTCLPWDGFC